MTRSRRAGQTNAPVEIEWRDEDLADRLASRELALDLVADQRGAPGRAADPEQRDVEAIPQVDDRLDPRVRDERPLRGGVVDQPRRHQPARLATERVGDPAVRLALRAGRPVAAAQRDDRHGDRRGGLLERGRHGCHRHAVADADHRAGADRAPEHLGGEPADHPPGQLLGTGDARREMDGVEPEPGPERVGGRALDRGPIDDPDLDDALRPGALEQARDLRPGDAELLGDRVLRLTQLVVQAAGPDELLEVAHRVGHRSARDRPRLTGAPTAVGPRARLYFADVHPRCGHPGAPPGRACTLSSRSRSAGRIAAPGGVSTASTESAPSKRCASARSIGSSAGPSASATCSEPTAGPRRRGRARSRRVERSRASSAPWPRRCPISAAASSYRPSRYSAQATVS